MAKEKIKKSNGIPFKEENAVGNYAEFSVSRKTDKEIILKRLIFALLYVAILVIFVLICFVWTKMAPVFVASVFAEWIAILATWHLSKIEYTYIVEKGNFHIYRICGRLKAKEVLNVRLENNLGVYPADNDEYKPKLDECEATLDFCEAKNADDVYFAIFELNGKKTAVYFSAANKLLTTMKYFGGENVVVTYVRH